MWLRLLESVLERYGKEKRSQLNVKPLIGRRPGPHLGKKALLQLLRQVVTHAVLDYRPRQRPYSPEASQGLPAISPSGLKTGATHSIHALGNFGVPSPIVEFEDTESDQTQALETRHDHM